MTSCDQPALEFPNVARWVDKKVTGVMGRGYEYLQVNIPSLKLT